MQFCLRTNHRRHSCVELACVLPRSSDLTQNLENQHLQDIDIVIRAHTIRCTSHRCPMTRGVFAVDASGRDLPRDARLSLDARVASYGRWVRLQ